MKQQEPYMNFDYVNKTSEKDTGVEFYYMELDGKPYTGMVYGNNPVYTERKEFDATVVNGRFHGWVITYFINGNVQQMEQYREGIRHGKIYIFDEAGNIKTAGIKEYGLYVSSKTWDAEGNLIESSSMEKSGALYDLYLLYKKKCEETWTIKTQEEIDADDQGFYGE